MSIRPIPGKPGQFIHTEVQWIAEGAALPSPGYGGTARIATDDLAFSARQTFLLQKRALELDMRSTTARRRRRRWRHGRRARGRQYAQLLASGPSSKRTLAIVIATPFRIGETRHSARWDTVVTNER